MAKPPLTGSTGSAHPAADYGALHGQVLLAGHPLAPPTDRLLARLIDGAIHGAVGLLLMTILLVAPLLVIALMKVESPIAYVVTAVIGLWLYSLASVGVMYAHEVTYQHRKGHTVGKRAMRVSIRELETGGVPALTVLRRRFVGCYAVSMLMAVPVLGWFLASPLGVYSYLNYLWCLWDKPHQQCLHDKYAKTAVVKLPPTEQPA